MYLSLPEFIIVVRQPTEARLAKTCFRKTHHAGAFTNWYSSQDILLDSFVQSELIDDAREAVQRNEYGTHSLEISYPRIVGYASTIDLNKVRHLQVEERNLNKRSTALFIVDRRIAAPKTNLITMIYELRRETLKNVIVIHSMYPGQDIGPLDGDISEREGVAFLEWSTPGEQKRNPGIRLGEKPQFGRPEGMHCQVCGKPTREGKPFCPEHIEAGPYVKRLEDKIRAMEEEELKASESKRLKISEDSELLKDIITELRMRGPQSTAKLARTFNVTTKLLNKYVEFMLKKKIVITDKTRRGATIIRLI